MTRIIMLAALPLLLTPMPASAGMTGQDSCTSAFLTEHLGPEDGAAMLRLWAASSNTADPSTTGSTGGAYDVQGYARASRRFLDMRAQYQMRCADQELEFE